MKITYWDIPKLIGTTFTAPGAGKVVYEVRGTAPGGIVVRNTVKDREHVADTELILAILNRAEARKEKV